MIFRFKGGKEAMRFRLWIAVTAIGLFLGAAQKAAAADLSAVYEFPNPVRVYSGNTQASFANLPAGATLRIYDVQGRLVREFTNLSGPTFVWNLTNADGQPLASGVYVYLVTDDDGHQKIGKVALLR